MDIKKIIRKNATLTSVVISLLLLFGLFFGMFLYWNQNVQSAGLSLDIKYNETYGNLTETQSNLKSNVDAIKDNLENIKEADSTWEVAWNGLKGLGNTLRLPISFVTTTIGVYAAIDYVLDYIPAWAKALFLIGLIALIVFLVLAIMKGEQKM